MADLRSFIWHDLLVQHLPSLSQHKFNQGRPGGIWAFSAR
jgi:hypothetical protein